MPKHDRVSIGRKSTPEGERVIFIKGTEVLTEVPTEVIREVVAFITKFKGEHGGASVTFTADGTYELHIAAWYGGQTWVTLYTNSVLSTRRELGT